MLKRFTLSLLIVLSAQGFASTLKDETFENPQLLTVGAGVFDIIKNPTHAMLQFEYRSTLTHFKKARPIVGLFVTQQGTTYVYGGMGYDIFFGKSVVFMPSFTPGLYYRGKGKKLWFPLEFRSAAELSRLGAQFYHISNASLGKKNPGVEALVLNYSFAL